MSRGPSLDPFARPSKRVAGLLIACLSGAASQPAFAEADGPDYWAVTGVASNDVLNLHAESGAKSPTIARIPHAATGLKNLGCSGVASFEQWQKMSEGERVRSARARWCKVQYNGKVGWVAGRFLMEGAAPASGERVTAVGPWTIRCQKNACSLSQAGVGAQRPSLLKIEKIDAGNARIVLERQGLAADGVLEIYMDGNLISSGPMAAMRAPSGDRLVMEPDDITAGLMRQIGRHKNMVIIVPGEERGIELHLDQFAAARKAALRR